MAFNDADIDMVRAETPTERIVFPAAHKGVACLMRTTGTMMRSATEMIVPSLMDFAPIKVRAETPVVRIVFPAAIVGDALLIREAETLITSTTGLGPMPVSFNVMR